MDLFANIQKYLQQRGLQELPPEAQGLVQNIIYELMEKGLVKTDQTFSLETKNEDFARISYLSAIIEQNWILIQQNQRIADKLDKLIDLSMSPQEKIEEQTNIVANLRKQLNNPKLSSTNKDILNQQISEGNKKLNQLKKQLRKNT
ncbi:MULTISPECIES: hypothetical protein [unclassified Streptococcus]|uniref:hypothetical protein n=1 Tax=unclassified Streptococcus TaxID=2608887 RepID=UPI00107176AE|nr:MULTISPECIES: hypothetical protein [unclassified Streptococcus]MBF0806733.1 hypothetical protein [Streptococcus sp. 19428wA2_WM07]TFU26356.1 hypothetical protein E4T71_08095 [Streptococcus sp. WM07]